MLRNTEEAEPRCLRATLLKDPQVSEVGMASPGSYQGNDLLHSSAPRVARSSLETVILRLHFKAKDPRISSFPGHRDCGAARAWRSRALFPTNHEKGPSP